MSRRRFRISAAFWRRLVQLICLVSFFGLVLLTRPVPGSLPTPWADLFFKIDPLVLLLTTLAAKTIVAALLLSLVTVVVTIVMGRVFCGWVCPLGTIHALAGRFFDLWRKRRRTEHWSRWHLAKYVILFGLILMAACGTQWPVLLDPIVILYRTTTVALLPAVQWGVEDASTAVYQHDPGVGDWRLTKLTEPVYRGLRDSVFVTPQQAFAGASWVLAFFVATLALNGISRRFWCRYVCPLGGLLGLLAWRPWLRRPVDANACTECDLCGMTCHGASSTKPGRGWIPQECLGCMNCTEACPPGGLSFKFSMPWSTRVEQESVDLARRELLGGVTAGVVGLALMRANPLARGNLYNPSLIRPPGSRDERDFLERCLGCGLCMKVCPTG
ncbi:MAG: 4Fe-4S binding protein, partial [Phycisphaerae bacterium]|nr:4Fe-4S binding protein [Phycisphaerae bacterium]